MSDFLTRLIGRSLAQTPAVQPRIDSVYAPIAGTVNAGHLLNPEIGEERESEMLYVSAEPSSEFSPGPKNVQSIDPVTAASAIDPVAHSYPVQISAEVESHIADLPKTTAPPRLVSADSSPQDVTNLVRSGSDTAIDRPRPVLVQPQIAAMYTDVASNAHDPAEDSTILPAPTVLMPQSTLMPQAATRSMGGRVDSEQNAKVASRSRLEPQIALADLRQQDPTIDPSPRSKAHSLNLSQQLVHHSSLPVEQPRLEAIATEPTIPATPPTIQVTIGRIEVRATRAAPVVRPPATRSQPALSLDDYLRQRNGGSP